MENPFQCLHEKTAIVVIQYDTSKHIAELCTTCAKRIKTFKAKDFTSAEIASFRVTTREKIDKVYDEFYKKAMSLWEERRKNEKKEWLLLHDEYLKSPQWKKKRQLVIERDKVCQGCLSSPIEEIHHLSYKNWTDELFFQLVGLCRSCHQKLHDDKNDAQN